MGYTDEILDEMSDGFESNFDAREALNLSPSEIAVHRKVQTKMAKAGMAPSMQAKGRDGVIKNYGQISSSSTMEGIIASSKGDLNITVTRNSKNINAALPYILFGLQGLPSNFVSSLKQFLPTGVTVTFSPNANGDLVGTYTNGVQTDTITISLSGGLISYSEFLQSMNQNFFQTAYVKQEYVKDANLLSSTSQMINFGLLSSLGAKNQNQLLPRSRRMSFDYNTEIVNLMLPEQKITADFAFIQNIIAWNGADDSYSIGWDVFMTNRVNLNKSV